MEIIVKFGSKQYIFYRRVDALLAAQLYPNCDGTATDFERRLAEEDINFMTADIY